MSQSSASILTIKRDATLSSPILSRFPFANLRLQVLLVMPLCVAMHICKKFDVLLKFDS